jgi:hypothetical protein
MMENKTILDHRGTTPGIYFGNMNDKIKQLLATAEKVDGISKIKWRIENRELLRKQRKLELKILMNKDKTTSVEWLVMQLWEEMNMQGDGAVFNEILDQAKAMHKAEIEESYQDGKEIGTIETLLKNKNL